MFKYRLKKTFYSIILWLALFFIPTGRVRAQFGIEILTAPFVFLAKAITAFILAVPLSYGCLALGQIILNWASNPNLTGGVVRNSFVMDAWGIVRDFTNLFFILIVVAIGIATALRIKSYEVKKTLPRLILVAILINFSPVICGVVIDASNIFMNFFLTAGSAGFGETMTLSSAVGDYMINICKNAMGNLSEIWKGILFFKLLIITIFNFFGAFLFFLLGGLFLVRHMALWILVILSPLAFLGAIFEKGGKDAKKLSMFARWRQEFIKWTFTGVTASFFVYLAQLMLHKNLQEVVKVTPATDVSDFGGPVITNMVKMLVPLIFLGIGYMTAVATSGYGAKNIIGFGKKQFGKINPLSEEGRANLNRLRQGINDQSRKRAPKKIRDWAQRTTAIKPEDRVRKYDEASFIKKVGMNTSRFFVPYKYREQMAGRIAQQGGEAKVQKTKEEKAKTDKMETEEALRTNYNKSRNNRNSEGQIASVQSAIDKGMIDKFSDVELIDTIKKASEFSVKMAEDIMNSVPDIAEKMYEEAKEKYDQIDENIRNNPAYVEAIHNGDMATADKIAAPREKMQAAMESSGLWLSQEEIAKHGNMENKIMANLKAKDVGKLSKKYIKKEETQKVILDIDHDGANAWSGNKLARMADEFGIEPVQNYNKVYQEHEQANPEWAQNNNPAYKWIENSPGAFAAGYRNPNTPQPEPEPEPEPDEPFWY